MSFDYADEGFDLDYSERQGFLVGKAARLADWRFRKEKKEFARLVRNIQQSKRLPYHKAWKARWRLAKHRANPPVHACRTCAVEFCTVRPTEAPPKYCSNGCLLMGRRQRRVIAQDQTCACGRWMTGRRSTCRTCAQRARRVREVGVPRERMEAADA